MELHDENKFNKLMTNHLNSNRVKTINFLDNYNKNLHQNV